MSHPELPERVRGSAVPSPAVHFSPGLVCVFEVGPVMGGDPLVCRKLPCPPLAGLSVAERC